MVILHKVQNRILVDLPIDKKNVALRAPAQRRIILGHKKWASISTCPTLLAVQRVLGRIVWRPT